MNHLLRVSDINSIVKIVVATSASLRLTALNAMLFSRNAGGKSGGFTTVTSELRKFSHNLNSTMATLTHDNYLMVERLAKLTSFQHRENILVAAIKNSSLNIDENTRHQIFYKKQYNREKIKNELKGLLDGFLKSIHTLSHICRNGESLALLVKIESKNSITHTAELDVISEAISDAVAKVTDMVNEINKLQTGLYEALFHENQTNTKLNRAA